MFRQEGMVGLRLPGCWLPEFVEALEKSNDSESFCVYKNIMCLNNRHGTTISVHARVVPLLQLSTEQRAKLIAHLRSTYAVLISVYR